MRIVSLLPSATEMVCALGLQESLVGVSHECDYPAGIEGLPKLTRSRLSAGLTSLAIDEQVRQLASQSEALFELDEQLLVELQPDLIVSQSLCDVCAVSDGQVQAAVSRMSIQPTIVRSGPCTLEDVLVDIQRLGAVAQVAQQAGRVVADLSSRINAVAVRARQKLATQPVRPAVLLLEWIDPLFSAGHWNPELIEIAGGQAVLGTAGQKSRQLDWEDVLQADPDFLLIAACGLSIDRVMEDLPRLVSYRNFGKLKCIDRGQVFLTDGSQYFNRPGPRLVDSLETLAHALDSQLHPLPPGLEPALRMKRA